MSYIIISVPTDKNPKNTKTILRNAIEKYVTDVTDFKIPPLKVGTLDQLMQLSDELLKVDQQGEQVVNKIERSFYDMLANKPTQHEEKKHKDKSLEKSKKKDKGKKPKVELKVGLNMQKPRQGNKPDTVNLLPNEYIKLFRWDRLYDSSKALKALSDDMLKVIVKADDDLKGQLASYSDFKSALEIIERKETGTLMVKPLGEFVKRKDMVDSGHLTTLMVVIPKNREEFFLQNYELLERQYKATQSSETLNSTRVAPTPQAKNQINEENKGDGERKETREEKAERLELEAEEEKKRIEAEIEQKKEEKRKKLEGMCENVIPRSAKLLVDENDFVLYRVVVFRKGAEIMKKLFRQERFTVRQFKYDPDDVSARRDQKQRLREKRRTAWNSVVRWCKVYFERIFKMWIHIKALRCFVETILRYGLPPNFQAYLIEIKGKHKDKLRSTLKTLYASLGNKSLMDEDTSNDSIVTTGMIGLSGDFHPYVSLDLNLNQEK